METILIQEKVCQMPTSSSSLSLWWVGKEHNTYIPHHSQFTKKHFFPVYGHLMHIYFFCCYNELTPKHNEWMKKSDFGKKISNSKLLYRNSTFRFQHINVCFVNLYANSFILKFSMCNEQKKKRKNLLIKFEKNWINQNSLTWSNEERKNEIKWISIIRFLNSIIIMMRIIINIIRDIEWIHPKIWLIEKFN